MMIQKRQTPNFLELFTREALVLFVIFLNALIFIILDVNPAVVNDYQWLNSVDIFCVIYPTAILLKKKTLKLSLRNFFKNNCNVNCASINTENVFDLKLNSFQDLFPVNSELKLGNTTLNGKMMFIYQALSAFNIWHGFKPDIDENVTKLLDQ